MNMGVYVIHLGITFRITDPLEYTKSSVTWGAVRFQHL